MRTKEGNKEQAIIEAAIKVFAETGYHESKISKIAEVAGIATGSIYLYFKNKEEILHKIFFFVWANLSKELSIIQKRDDLTPVEKLESMLDLIFDLFTENPHLAIVFCREHNINSIRPQDPEAPYFNNFLDMGEKIVIEGVEKNIFNSNINIAIFKHFVLGGAKYILHQWAENPKDFPLNIIRQNMKFFIKKGILLAQ
jgi:TetR/AcrR family fatty acid metabolism transcriptional regulator